LHVIVVGRALSSAPFRRR